MFVHRTSRYSETEHVASSMWVDGRREGKFVCEGLCPFTIIFGAGYAEVALWRHRCRSTWKYANSTSPFADYWSVRNLFGQSAKFLAPSGQIAARRFITKLARFYFFAFSFSFPLSRFRLPREENKSSLPGSFHARRQSTVVARYRGIYRSTSSDIFSVS